MYTDSVHVFLHVILECIASTRSHFNQTGKLTFEFLALNTKLPEMAMLASNDFTAANKVSSSGARLN